MRRQRCQIAAAVSAVTLIVGGVAAPASAAPTTVGGWSVNAPDRSGPSARLQLDASGTPRLSVTRAGRTVLLPGRLGVTTAAHDFTTGLRVLRRRDRTVHERYTMTTGKKLRRSATMRQATFTLRGADGATLELVVRVADDGVAYRYVLGGSGPVTVEREASTFAVPTAAQAWVQPYQNSYETERTQATAGTANSAQPKTCTGTTCSFGYPTLFKVGGNYLLLTESDVDGRYSGSHLDHADGSSRYTVVLADDAPVTAPGPLSTPWRTAIIGDLPTVVGSTLVDDLAPPSRLSDTSWIRPGVVDWSWLSEHSSPGDPARQRDYVDFAAAHGLDYTLIDAGWQASWVPGVVRYARARGVNVILWFDWNGMKDQRERDTWLAKVKSWGVAGVKVDYMDSDAQSTFAWYDGILRDTAKYHLMIDFHGATIPRGIQRTWPQVMSVEGVRGEENGQNATRNIFLAFTRNIVGSMDYTPTWFSRPGRVTSLAHELALPVVYESGWTHLGDNPEGFDAVPVAEKYLEQLPATWDETKLVAGGPDQLAGGDRQAVIARRNGDRWFVGGILAGAADTMTAPLSFLGRGRWLLETVRDSDGALSQHTSTVTAGDSISVPAPENGGFAAIACPATPGRTSCAEPVVTAPETSLAVTPAGTTVDVPGTVAASAAFTLPSGSALRRVRMSVDRDRLPEGWSVNGSDVTAGRLPAGRTLHGRWTLRVPGGQPAGVVDVPVVVTYANPAGGAAIHVERVVAVSVPPHGQTAVSGLPFVASGNSWGPVERDMANGEEYSADGSPISLHGTGYPAGLGTNADSDVTVSLAGRCSTFVVTVGIDDEVAPEGSVTFTVIGDGTTLTTTPTLRYADGVRTLRVDVTGVDTLRLVVGDAGDGNDSDHADWAAPTLTCQP